MTIKDWCNEQRLSVKKLSTTYLRRIRKNALKTSEKHDIVPASLANEDPKPEHEKAQ